ncbi:MAG: type II toxin-antitoxin system RelB/DinJ family antitoxin [Clostridiales bacterium]|nr:type II toxin-antitoxin system RelB/DinJ family antitoxin [Clostridiales bacterium]
MNVTIRLDKDVKEKAESMFNDFGMNLSTAVNVFVRQALRQGKIPFEISDPFYSEKNQAELRRRIADINAGANLTIHELIETNDE